MLSLNSRLQTIGLSAARGVDLVMQRDQLKATLPRSEAGAATAKPATETSAPAAEPATTPTTAVAKAGKQVLTSEQQQQVRELQRIDQNVRAHEQAHLSAGQGVVTSGASFTYTYGPDNKQYAVAGEVGIDTSAEREPQANIDKGLRIQAAALAPRDPSPQDYQVAAVGSRLVGQGQSDLVVQRQQEQLAAQEAAREQRAAAGGETAAGQLAPVQHAAAVEPVTAGASQADSSATAATAATDSRRALQDVYRTTNPAAAARVDTFA